MLLEEKKKNYIIFDFFKFIDELVDFSLLLLIDFPKNLRLLLLIFDSYVVRLFIKLLYLLIDNIELITRSCNL